MENTTIKIDEGMTYFDDLDYKSKIVVGNVTMFCLKRFNWFQRKMLKMFFGFEASNIGGNNE